MTARHDPDQMLALLTHNRRVLDEHLKAGDVLTHAGALGCLEEHVFAKRHGLWLLGYPTQETSRLTGASNESLKAISPVHVTHLNRVPLAGVPMLGLLREQRRLEVEGDAPQAKGPAPEPHP